jgi:hypothetical protein
MYTIYGALYLCYHNAVTNLTLLEPLYIYFPPYSLILHASKASIGVSLVLVRYIESNRSLLNLKCYVDLAVTWAILWRNY